MKLLNIIPLLIAFALFQGCNQLDSELDTLDGPNVIVADIDYTLTDDDYDSVDKTFGNFNSEDEAKELIPGILTANYPQFGNGSSASVNYDIFSPIRINNSTDSTLTEMDYENLDQGFGTLSSDGDIIEAAEYVHGTPENNDVVSLTYEWFCFGCPIEGTNTSKVTYYEGRWYVAYSPTDDDYTFMGQSFPNFDSRSTGRERIGKLLDTRYLFDDPGTIRSSVFTYTFKDTADVRQFVDFMTVYEFDGSNWQPFNDVVTQALQLGHDGSTWVPDNTIKYTLSADDYTAIATAAEADNPDGASSMSSFGNFDVGLWPETDIITFVGGQIATLFPTVEGQKYLVSYDTWEPGAGVRDIYLIYEGGEYVKFE